MEAESSSPNEFEYRCSCCGKVHRGSPSFGAPRPALYYDVPEGEHKERVQSTDDMCVIRPANDDPEGHTIFYIRGTLDIPIIGADEPFCWGVWVSQSEESFERYVETYDDDQSEMGSFGWLVCGMPGYDQRRADGHFESLGCDVYWGPKGERPKIEVHECDHPLFIDQRDGISWEKAARLAEAVIHPEQ